MRPARAGECTSEPEGCTAVRVPGRELPSSGITTRDSFSLIGRTEDCIDRSVALLRLRPAFWLKQARHGDIYAVVYLPCAKTFCGYFSHLWTSTLRLPLMTKKSRGCGTAQISKTSVSNQREFRPARLANAAKRPADWPLRGSGRQLRSEDRVSASRTGGKARSSGSGS